MTHETAKDSGFIRPAGDHAAVPAVSSEVDLRERALSLYEPPFRYEQGYIFDAQHEVVADHPDDFPALRIRGWGRIAYLEDAEALQDAVGALIAEALTEFWQWERAVRDGKDETPAGAESQNTAARVNKSSASSGGAA